MKYVHNHWFGVHLVNVIILTSFHVNKEFSNFMCFKMSNHTFIIIITQFLSALCCWDVGSAWPQSTKDNHFVNIFSCLMSMFTYYLIKNVQNIMSSAYTETFKKFLNTVMSYILTVFQNKEKYSELIEILWLILYWKKHRL